jgi:hypothetical protein
MAGNLKAEVEVLMLYIPQLVKVSLNTIKRKKKIRLQILKSLWQQHMQLATL